MARRPTWLRASRGLVVGLVVVVALVVVAVGLAVVAGAGGGGPSGATTLGSGYPEPALAPGKGADAASGSGGGAGPPVGVGAPVPERGAAVGLGGAAAPGAPAQGVPVGGVARSLVRTAQLTVEVDDAAASARRVRTAAAAVGGNVAEEQSGDGGGLVVLRVPADSLDRLLDDIAAFGHVTGRTTQIVDATEQVVDLDARVASQQASVSRVRTLLAQATSIGDVVAIESELARREADLDSLTSRLTALRDQVALSTLTVDLRTPSTPARMDGAPAPGFLDGLRTGWDGLRVLGSVLASALGFALPFLAVLAVLLGIGWLARRIVRARRVRAASGGRSDAGSAGRS